MVRRGAVSSVTRRPGVSSPLPDVTIKGRSELGKCCSERLDGAPVVQPDVIDGSVEIPTLFVPRRPARTLSLFCRRCPSGDRRYLERQRAGSLLVLLTGVTTVIAAELMVGSHRLLWSRPTAGVEDAGRRGKRSTTRSLASCWRRRRLCALWNARRCSGKIQRRTR